MTNRHCAALAASILCLAAAPLADAKSCSAKIRIQNDRGKMVYVRELEFRTKGGGWTGASAEGPKFIKKGRAKTWGRIDLPVIFYDGLRDVDKVRWRAIWSVADKKHDARSRTFVTRSPGYLKCGKAFSTHEITIDEKILYRK